MPSPYGHPQAGDIDTPPRYAARLGSTADIAALTACSTTQDAGTLVENDVLAVLNNTDSSENGLYLVGAVTSGTAPLTRHEKMRSGAGVPCGTTIWVEEGTANGGKLFAMTEANPVVVDTDNLVFAELLGAAKAVQLKLAIDYTATNNAVLYTVPSGKKLLVQRMYWEVTTGFTGGNSSAIGASSSNAAYNTAGDLLGGSGGDVTATLGTPAAAIGGTLGAKFGTNGAIVLVAGDTIRFNRIASIYTAGAGFVHVAGTWVS